MGILRTDTISGLETPTPVTGSVSFDGSGDYLSLASSNDFAYGTYDFTWEGWLYVENFDSGKYILDHGTNVGIIEIFSSSGKMVYYNSTTGGGSSLYTTGFGTISINTWHHFAAVRNGGTTFLYLNGNLSTSASDGHNYNGSTSLNIGRYGGDSNYFSGYISNLRILKGTALYTSNFTPPTRELQPIGDTVLLCCNNPDSAGAEATGKTITVNGDAVASTFSPGLTRDFTYGTQFDGVSRFDTQGYFVPPSGTTEQQFPNFAGVDASSARGVFMGGGNTPRVNTIDYVTISTLGDATDFGDLSAPNYNHTGGASNTRGIIGGGLNPANTNLIEYITIQSTGNTKDFGDLSSAIEQMGGASNSTRCLFAGGYTTEHVNTIDFITISTSGNTFDFGDLTATKRGQGGLASPNRALFAAGGNPGVSVNIDYVTIMSTGNAVDFGDISGSGGRQGNNGCSTNTRGCWGGGYNGPAGTDAIQYVTIATLGNAQPFGDLSVATLSSGATSSSTRGVWGGGYKPAVSNTIEYITMATLGDANNFGDLSQARVYTTSVSNGHGGLG